MNCVNIRVLSMAVVLSAVNCVRAVETEGEPPWNKGVRYEVKSTYEMSLENVVLDVDVKKGKTWCNQTWGFKWISDSPDKVIAHVRSEPFAGKYICRLNYKTGHVEKRGQSGSAFRSFDQSNIEFLPIGSKDVVFTHDQGFWRWLFDMEGKKTVVHDVKPTAEKAEFYFSQVFNPDKAKINYANWFFVGWKQKDATSHRKNLDVWEGIRLDRNPDVSPDARREIWSGHPEWRKCFGGDMAYNVIQAEAKLMTYAIYGQTETRRLGEAWTTDAEILTAFLPQLSKEEQPFVFEGGSIVLKVVKSENGIQTIEMLPNGKVNGKNESSDLRIQSSAGNMYNSTFDAPDLANSRENYVRFEVDEDHSICRMGKVNIVLHRYSGKVPNMGQLKLEGATIDGERLDSRIVDGVVRIHAEISTEVNNE